MGLDYILVFCGGGLGAMARYSIGKAIKGRRAERFPWGTMVVNVLGALVLGIIAGDRHFGIHALLLFDIGFVGSFTTFSSLSYETLELLQKGFYGRAFLNPCVSLVLGFLGLWLGMMVGVVL